MSQLPLWKMVCMSLYDVCMDGCFCLFVRCIYVVSYIVYIVNLNKIVIYQTHWNCYHLKCLIFINIIMKIKFLKNTIFYFSNKQQYGYLNGTLTHVSHICQVYRSGMWKFSLLDSEYCVNVEEGYSLNLKKIWINPKFNFSVTELYVISRTENSTSYPPL